MTLNPYFVRCVLLLLCCFPQTRTWVSPLLNPFVSGTNPNFLLHQNTRKSDAVLLARLDSNDYYFLHTHPRVPFLSRWRSGGVCNTRELTPLLPPCVSDSWNELHPCIPELYKVVSDLSHCGRYNRKAFMRRLYESCTLVFGKSLCIYPLIHKSKDMSLNAPNTHTICLLTPHISTRYLLTPQISRRCSVTTQLSIRCLLTPKISRQFFLS